MNFDEVIRSRRSIRKFKPDALPEHTIEKLINAAMLAPSGLNLQPWRFVAVQDEAVRKLVGDATPSHFVMNAPVILVCCMDLSAFSGVEARIAELAAVNAVSSTAAETFGSDEIIKNIPEQWIHSQLAMYTAIAITHMLLKATDLGLGSCWVGQFDEAKVKAAVGLDARHSVLALLPVGYAGQEPAARPRLPVEKVLLGVM